jgi:hypothetical protein
MGGTAAEDMEWGDIEADDSKTTLVLVGGPMYRNIP